MYKIITIVGAMPKRCYKLLLYGISSIKHKDCLMDYIISRNYKKTRTIILWVSALWL